MTQTQKFLKVIENIVGFPPPKGKVARRLKQRGSEYRSRMDSLSAAHERKRLLLLRLRNGARLRHLPLRQAERRHARLLAVRRHHALRD